MAVTETVNQPANTLSDGEVAGMLTELLAKADTLTLALAEVSGQLARLDARFGVVEATIAEVRMHPWVARLLKKSHGHGPVV